MRVAASQEGSQLEKEAEKMRVGGTETERRKNASP